MGGVVSERLAPTVALCAGWTAEIMDAGAFRAPRISPIRPDNAACRWQLALGEVHTAKGPAFLVLAAEAASTNVTVTTAERRQ